MFGVDWGVPDEADADMGLAEFICDELHWAIRETRRACDADELTLLGWCIGGTLCAIYCALHPVVAVRNAALLTTPIEPNRSLYANWVGHDEFDVDLIAIAAARPVAPKRDRYSGVGALAAPARLHSRGGAPDPHAGRLALQFSEKLVRRCFFGARGGLSLTASS